MRRNKRILVATSMMILTPVAPLSALEVPPGSGVQVGDRCEAGQPAPRPGLICKPAFVQIEGQTREEWEYEIGHVLNGRRGDAVLSPGCGLVANLLKKVNPSQKYSHSGIMVEDRFKIRHSTAAEERIIADSQGLGDPSGTEGRKEDALKYAWPGTITQWSDEAFEGAVLTDPNGEDYLLEPFNKSPIQCPDSDGDLIPAVVLKPPPLVDADPNSFARARLEFAANAATNIHGHYRFYGYSRPDEVLSTPVSLPGHWADGTVGSVCSAFIWRAMKDIGMTLEGGVLESTDQGKVVIGPTTPDGLYHYSEEERLHAGEFLYGEIYDMVYAQTGGLGDLIFDAADDTANQLLNCFGFDWCGPTYTSAAAQAGCDSGDNRAQDSSCWRDEGPRFGEAVSPDDLQLWDAAPAGPYGYQEPLAYAPGGYFRVWRWEKVAGAGSVKGTVFPAPTSTTSTLVAIEGLAAVDFADLSGAYEIDAVPAANWTVRACNTSDQGAAAIVSVPINGTLTQDLTLNSTCAAVADPGTLRRQVRIHGNVKITDTEDFGSDVVGTYSFDETHTLEPSTADKPDAAKAEFSWQRCTGEEVRAKLQFTLRLDQHDKSVHVETTARMFEGESCNNDDLNDTVNKDFHVAENASTPLIMNLLNEESGGEDTIKVNLTVDNFVSP